MAKRQYVARRTSSFMPYDQGNKWVVIEPNGDILTDYTNGHSMGQNEAIALAKKLNAEKDN